MLVSSDTVSGNSSDVILPPDQSLRISTLQGRLLILSVSDMGLLLGAGTPYEDFTSFLSGVYIFAEGIGFTSSISSPCGLTVAANSIASPLNVRLSSSGLSAEDQSDPTVDAEPGESAGALNFYVQSGTDENARNISYVASGGNGGRTIQAGGQGGGGGDGGNIVRIFQSLYSTCLKAFAAFLARKDLSSTSPEDRVSPEDSIYLEALNLSALPMDDMSPGITSAMKSFQDILAAINKGESRTLHQLIVSARHVRNALVIAIDVQKVHSFVASAEYTGGFPGAGKGVVGKPGSYGKPGKDHHLIIPQHDTSYNLVDDALSIRKAPFAFAHPEQCTMLLTRAKTFYSMGSPILHQQAAQMFRRIIDRLSFLPLKEDDPLYKAYADSFIIPNNALEILQSVRTEAETLLAHLLTDSDYNGYAAAFVPRASYTFYKSALDTAIVDLQAFEQAYTAYSTALKKQEALQDAVGRALYQTDAMIASITADMKDLTASLFKADNQVQVLTQPVLDAQRALMKAYKDLEDKINDSFGLSVPQLVNALTSIAFAPTKGMGSLQIANLAYEGFNTVPDLNETPVNKRILIGQLKQSAATVDGIKATLSQSRLDGTFELDDPYGTRLLAIESDLMSFLSNYASSAFTKVMDQIKSKFDDYIQAVIGRNTQALRYNIALKLLVQKAASKKEYVEKRKQYLGKAIKANDPDLPTITAYMESIYQSSRARVMKLLNLVVRSLNFRMLDENDIFTIACSDGSSTDTVPLTMTSTVLLSARAHIEDGFRNYVEHWGAEPSKFPPNFDSARGKRIMLKNSELQTLISDGYTADVDIPTVFKETTPTNDFSGSCNVRIYRVRFGFTGLKVSPLAKSARVTVRMVHSGEESLVDKLNAEHHYTHDPISVVYSYALYPDGSTEVLDNGNIAEADVNNQATSYAAPGPFTTWTVSLLNSELSHLDFSEVKAAFFDFCGTDYALA